MNLTNGILIADKPEGWTSHDVCAFVRGRFRIKKVGHAGTLDPMATGVLVLLLGQATKQSAELSGRDKSYQGTMELGVKTGTHDRQGEVIATASWEQIGYEQIVEKAKQFTGDILQVPPMVSALKHRGVPLYRLARRGVEVEREARKVTVHQLNIEEQNGAFIKFTSTVSKGTYVRTLVNDLGEVLGCYATLASLRRLRSGEFDLSQAVTIEDMKQMAPSDLGRHLVSQKSPAEISGHVADTER